jgi:hypothetical protein
MSPINILYLFKINFNKILTATLYHLSDVFRLFMFPTQLSLSLYLQPTSPSGIPEKIENNASEIRIIRPVHALLYSIKHRVGQ